MTKFDDLTDVPKLEKLLAITKDADAFSEKLIGPFWLGKTITPEILRAMKSAVAMGYYRGAENALDVESDMEKELDKGLSVYSMIASLKGEKLH